MSFEKIPLLDHGYIRLIETWGSDERIIEAARMSTDKGFLGWGTPEAPGDEKLLAYLYNHQHMSPFEMGGMIIEVQAPIFIFREWHRHRTQSYNELSARYTTIPDVHYVPSVDRIVEGSKPNSNKQASGKKIVTPEEAGKFIESLQNLMALSQSTYTQGQYLGVPNELARLAVLVNRYSRMRASAILRNWLAFLTLRMDKSAQWEIQQYAQVVSGLIKMAFPRTHELFVEGRK